MAKHTRTIHRLLHTPYTFGNYTKEALSKLEIASEKLYQWFGDNRMKSNLDKCYLMCSTDEEVSLDISDEKIRNNKYLKLLGINIDYRLTFHIHINEIREKAGQKLNTFSRMIASMDFP